MSRRRAAVGWILALSVVLGSAVGLWQQAAGADEMVIGDSTIVRFEYTLSVDGKEVDRSSEGEPYEYTTGRSQVIPGLERQLMGLRAGEERDVTVQPEEGYGAVDADAVDEVPKNQLPPSVEPQVGMRLTGRDPGGRTFLATIKEVKPESVVLDLNHPFAGKTLQFHVKILDVKAVQ